MTRAAAMPCRASFHASIIERASNVGTSVSLRAFEQAYHNRRSTRLQDIIRLVGPNRAVEILGVRLAGLLEVAGRHTLATANLSAEALREMQRRYFMEKADLRPNVYYRLTSNWLELTLRFVT